MHSSRIMQVSRLVCDFFAVREMLDLVPWPLKSHERERILHVESHSGCVGREFH